MTFLFMEEIWKEIPGYEGLYEFSNLGRLKSLSRIAPVYAFHKNCLLKELIRKVPKNPTGNRSYRTYALVKNGVRKTCYIHKLMGLCFLYNDDPINKTQVNHIDGNKLNDNIENLEWCTPGENLKHAWDTGLRTKLNQENHPRSKMVKNIQTGEVFNSMKELSEIVGIPHSTIRSRLNGTYKNKTNYTLI